MACANCINYIEDGIECLEGHIADESKIDCDDWLYGGE